MKFLFLPPEHDPDSYIREFGKEGFARCISEATPLSRFLIEAVREGCDLGSAEGRARLASQARPLWTLLPEGALKRQLFGEFAALVQLGVHELDDLWHPRSAAPGHTGATGDGTTRRYKKNSDMSNIHRSRSHFSSESGNGGFDINSGAAPRRAGVRVAPASRADHAARLLLGNMAAWDTLSTEDHSMLAELPEPHGVLFAWLESQLHELGAQPWGALREGLRGQPFEALALRVMTALELPLPEEHLEEAQELRQLLNRMLIERIKAQETLAIRAAGTDPTALDRYRALQTRRRDLEARSG